MKACSTCKLQKPIEDYIKKKQTRDGLNGICKDCRRIHHREWYHKKKHDASFIEKRNRYHLISRQRLMKIIVDYLNDHPCVDCGEKDIIVLDFDHTRDKIRAVSDILRYTGSKDKIIAEIAKCEVRCANCHRRKTAERGHWYLKQGFLTQ